MKIHIIHCLALLMLACFTGAQSARATTINWGTYFDPFRTSSLIFDSNGNPLDDTYVFELGTFGSFIPTQSNLADWAVNWKVFDRAMMGDGWLSSSGTIGHSATLEEDFTTSNPALSQAVVFTPGEQAFIWAYRDASGSPTPSPIFDASFQWALLTDNDGLNGDDWILPAPSGHVALSLDWRIEDATFSPFGGLLDTQYDGDFSSTPGSFILQTHTAPVPEPGSALLLALPAVLGLRRRRRPAPPAV